MKEVDWQKYREKIEREEEASKAYREGGIPMAAAVMIIFDLLWVLPCLYLGGYFDERMNIVKWLATVFVIVCEVFVVVMNKKGPDEHKKGGAS